MGASTEDRDQPAIDALVGRFFSAFSNRHGLSNVASIPHLFLPRAVVTEVSAKSPGGVEVTNLREFIAPRAELLQGERLVDFEEHETTGQTEIQGRLAHRASRYVKSGRLDGVPFEGAGRKHFELVRTARGWKIAALTWEDDAG